MAQGKWEACLNDQTSMARNVAKDNSKQKKNCKERMLCLQKGYDKPLASNISDTFEGSHCFFFIICTLYELLPLEASFCKVDRQEISILEEYFIIWNLGLFEDKRRA